MQQLPSRYVITVGRTFGSGGRDLGRIIAERLGIGFYDKELLVKAAAKAGYDIGFITASDERAPKLLGGVIPFSMGFYPLSWVGEPSANSDKVYAAQCEFIHELAERESCVIVGRSADYILRDHPAAINIFLHASVDDCVDRVIGRGEADNVEQARSLIEKTNRMRENFYNFYAEKEWGKADSYDLCFDSSKLPLADIAEIVIDYLNRRLKK